jgi:hypothetical protein
MIFETASTLKTPQFFKFGSFFVRRKVTDLLKCMGIREYITEA